VDNERIRLGIEIAPAPAGEERRLLTDAMATYAFDQIDRGRADLLCPD
jgi:hypothetical protein